MQALLKPKMRFWQILNMNVGFFGIQFSFGLQQSNMSSIYRYLGADETELPLLWLAGPMTGLLVQPIIGAISDETWSPRWGRRKPFFLIGAVLCSLTLLAMPYSQSLWMAAGLLWILDAANNIAMEPYRAFISDRLDREQLSIGFLTQSFFTGLGATLSNFAPAILISMGLFTLTDTRANGIPEATYWAFGIGAVASIVTVLISVLTTKELPPTQHELEALKERKAQGTFFSRNFREVGAALVNMPLAMRRLIPVKFFTWYAMFCYWQYLTSALAKSQFGTLDETSLGFKTAQVLTGQLNGTYNIFCFLLAFALVPLARKIGPRKVHAVSLVLGGVGVCAIPALNVNQILFEIPSVFGGDPIPVSSLFVYTIGLGVAWASMLAMPYQILAGAIPKEKTGIYMGVFNMFIVIPMMIQIFTMQFFVYDWLGSDPVRVLQLAGVFLGTGGLLTLAVPRTIQMHR